MRETYGFVNAVNLHLHDVNRILNLGINGFLSDKLGNGFRAFAVGNGFNVQRSILDAVMLYTDFTKV